MANNPHLARDPAAPPGRRHRQQFTVEAHHVTPLGHVDHAVYLQWVQHTVIAHWQRFAPEEAVHDHLWVALSHEITYHHPAFLGDAITLESTVERLFGARAFFRTSIMREDEVLSEVVSSWCCVDVAAYRPVRLAPEITRHFIAKGSA